MRSDMLSLDIDKVPHLHELLVSLPCAPLGIAGGGAWSSSLGYLPAPYLHKGGSLYNTRLPHLVWYGMVWYGMVWCPLNPPSVCSGH
jgi:hypothetical protein